MWIALLIGALLVIGLAIMYPITLVVIVPLVAGFIFFVVQQSRKEKTKQAQNREEKEKEKAREAALSASPGVANIVSPPDVEISSNPAIIDVSMLQTLSIATTTTIRPEEEAKPKAIARLPGTIDGFDLVYNYQIPVAGAQHYDTSHVTVGDIVAFRPEPDNAYDGGAVALFVEEKKIGYMHKNNQQSMCHDFIQKGDLVYGAISVVEPESMKMLIGFYEKNMYSSYMDSGRSFKVYKLTANKNEDMQENISYCTVGERITATYDYDKGKYAAAPVGCTLEIGYFPKAAEDNLGPKNIRAYIHEIGDNDDANFTQYVRVAIF